MLVLVLLLQLQYTCSEVPVHMHCISRWWLFSQQKTRLSRLFGVCECFCAQVSQSVRSCLKNSSEKRVLYLFSNNAFCFFLPSFCRLPFCSVPFCFLLPSLSLFDVSPFVTSSSVCLLSFTSSSVLPPTRPYSLHSSLFSFCLSCIETPDRNGQWYQHPNFMGYFLQEHIDQRDKLLDIS